MFQTVANVSRTTSEAQLLIPAPSPTLSSYILQEENMDSLWHVVQYSERTITLMLISSEIESLQLSRIFVTQLIAIKYRH